MDGNDALLKAIAAGLAAVASGGWLGAVGFAVAWWLSQREIYAMAEEYRCIPAGFLRRAWAEGKAVWMDDDLEVATIDLHQFKGLLPPEAEQPSEPSEPRTTEVPSPFRRAFGE